MNGVDVASRDRMGKSVIMALVLAVGLGLIVSVIYAAAPLDYPHFSINSVGCENCHLPHNKTEKFLNVMQQEQQDIDDTPVNNLCWSCHNDWQAPLVRTHSSLQIDDDYGNWSMECRRCHWPHQQMQFRTYGSDSYLYSNASSSITNTTLTQNVFNWTTDQYEGLVVIPNITEKDYNYKIINNTNDTLNIEGPMDLTKVEAGATFAIVYGKLIKSTISTPKRDTCEVIGNEYVCNETIDNTTRFFNASGANSFADGDATYDGVCEVCHTQPTHFRNNGSGSDQLHSNMEPVVGGAVNGTACTSCHRHLYGFRPMGGGAHPTHVSEPYGPQITCRSGNFGCHGSYTPPLLRGGTNLTNTTVCNDCHSSNGNATAKQYWFSPPGSSTGTSGSWAMNESYKSFCGSCHDSTPGIADLGFGGTGDQAPNILGDNSTYGFYVTGHGVSNATNYSRLSWQDSSANGNPGANRTCSDCHELTSTHYNNSGKRLRSGYENDANNSVCRQCHEPGRIARNGPLWYTNYTEFQNSAHGKNLTFGTNKCTGCHDPHGANGTYTAMARGQINVTSSTDSSNFCYQCHTDPGSGGIENIAISGPDNNNDIQEAFSENYRHDLGTSFTINGSTYSLQCTSCHNVHIVSGKYWDADQGLSPVSRFSSKTEVWGDDLSEKMDALSASLGGVYQKLDGDLFTGGDLPDYVNFCLDCHRYLGVHGNWLSGAEPHGGASADTPPPSYYGFSNNACPDWMTCGYVETGWPRIPLLRGYQSGNKDPYSQEQRIAGVNYVLACIDCHEAHGSQFDSNFRTVINNASVSNLDWNNGICNKCHWHNTAWHATLSCGSASCHDTGVGNSIHGIQNNMLSDSPPTLIFDPDLVFDLEFAESSSDQTNCIIRDSGDFNLHSMFLPRTFAPFNEDNNIRPSGCDQYYVTESGNRSQVLDLDGTRTMIMGATICTSDCWAPPTWDRGTYALFEMKYNVTVMAWIKPVSYPPSEIPRRVNILGNEREGTGFDLVNYGLSLVMIDENGNGDDPDDLRLDFHVSVGNISEPKNGIRGAYSSAHIPLNKWTFVAATFDFNGPDGVDGDPSVGRIRIYVDGQDVTKSGAHPSWMYLYQPEAGYNTIYSASDAVDDPDVNCDDPDYPGDDIHLCWQPFTVGGCGAYTFCNGLAGPHFNGRLDGVRVYNVLKTPAEIQAIFDSERDPVSAYSAIASDSSGGGYGIQAGDTVVISFSGATNGLTINKTNIDSVLALSNGHTWLDGSGNIGSAVWSTVTYANDTLTITLNTTGGTPTVKSGDTITFNGHITDTSNNEVYGNVQISAHFGGITEAAVAYWKFEEGSGTTAFDETANNNDGTTNGTTWSTGKFGGGLLFDGVNDYVEVADNQSLDFPASSGFTIETWVKINSTTASGVILSKYGAGWNPDPGGSENSQYLLSINTNRQPYFYVRDTTDSTGQTVTAPGAISVGVWHHIVGVRDIVNSRLRIYVDGQEATSAVLTETGDMTNANRLIMGAKEQNGGAAYEDFFNGQMDETVIYNRALSAFEISQRYGVWLKEAVASDASGEGPGVQAGDQVVITFDGGTRGTTINASNIDTALALSSGHTWLDGSGNIGSAVWSTTTYTKDTLTITLNTTGGTPTVFYSDTITLDGTILDINDRSINGSIDIFGSFGELPPDTRAYWKFEEGSGTTAFDETAYNNDGTTNGTTWTTGRYGSGTGALAFDGVNDYVEVADSSSLNFGSLVDFTLEAWVKINPGESGAVLYKYGYGWNPSPGGTQPSYYKLSINGNQQPEFRIRDENDWTSQGITSPTQISAGLWHHLVGVRDVENRSLRLYVDGREVVNAELFETGPVQSDNRLIIGAAEAPASASYSEFLGGSIDEAAIYARALSASEIAERYGTWPETAAASDSSGGGYGIQAGDTVVISFSRATAGTVINKTNIDSALALSNGHTWLDGSGNIGSAVWSTVTYANDTLTITLSSASGAPTVAPEDVITLDDTIRDSSGRSIVDSVTITGDFGGIPYGAVAYWKFEEGSGTTAFDEIANNNDGTINGSTWTTGRYGGGLSFDGVNDYVEVADSSSLNFASGVDFTVEAWVYINTGGNIMSKYSTAFYRLGLTDSPIPYFELRDTSVGASQQLSWFTITTGEWHHLVGVRDTANLMLRLYLDGSEINSATLTETGDVINTNPLSIGARNSGSSYTEFFGGVIDEVIIYNRALSAQDVQDRYNSFFAPTLNSIPLSDQDGAGNPDAEFTNDQTVTITIDATGNPSQMMISENSDFSGADWIGYSATYAYTFTNSTNGLKTVYLKLKNAGGESGVQSDTITLDTVSPTILTTTLTAPNGGEVWDAGSSMNITWTAGDITDANLKTNPIELTYSTDSGVNYSGSIAGSQANTGSYSWTLPIIDSNTVRVKLTAYDMAGNAVSDTSDNDFTIQLQPPTLDSISLEDSNSSDPSAAETGYTNNQSVTVTINSSGNPPAEMILAESADFTANSTGWISFQTLYMYTLSAGDGSKTVYCKLRNPAGESGSQSDTIVLDTVSPTILTTTLTAPNGGEVWTEGTSQNITWTAGDITDANLKANPIDISCDTNSGTGGYPCTIATGLANTGSYTWTGNAIDSTTVRMKITAYDRAGNAASDESDADFTVESSAVAFLEFDEGSGGTAYDSAGSNHGTISGATWTTDSKSGYALNFDGNDLIDFATSTGLDNLRNNFTIMMWIKADSTLNSMWDPITFWHDASSGYVWQSSSDGSVLYVMVGGTGGLYSTPFTVDLRDDQWHHLAVVKKDTSPYVELYLDGSLDNSNSNSGLSGDVVRSSNGWDLRLGNSQCCTRYFKGIMDEVVIYDRALTAQEVQDRYNL